MRKVYKGLFALYVVHCIVGAAFVVFADFLNIEIWLGLILTIVWIFIGVVAYGLAISGKDIKKLQHLNNCTPSKFILHAEKAYPLITDVNYKSRYSLNLFAAYHDLGQREKAIDYLLKVNTDFQNNANGNMAKITYHINMSVCYQDTKNFDHAELELKAAEEVLQSDRLNKALKNDFFIICQSHRYGLNMDKGIFEGAEEFFSGRFELEKTIRGKVSIKLQLAEIYRHNGDLEKAVDACNYVIANGGETRFVSEAKEMLHEISNE